MIPVCMKFKSGWVTSRRSFLQQQKCLYVLYNIGYFMLQRRQNADTVFRKCEHIILATHATTMLINTLSKLYNTGVS